MPSLYTIQQTAKRIKIFNALAAVMAFPAALGFAWLWLIEGQQRGLLGFALIWLLVAGVSLRVYAQFLRWWHQLDYSAAPKKAACPSSRSIKGSRVPRNVQDEALADLEKRLLAVAVASATTHAGNISTRRAFALNFANPLLRGQHLVFGVGLSSSLNPRNRTPLSPAPLRSRR